MAQYSMRWCDICKRWVAYYNESTVVRCPYCDNDFTIEKPPKEVTGNGTDRKALVRGRRTRTD